MPTFSSFVPLNSVYMWSVACQGSPVLQEGKPELTGGSGKPRRAGCSKVMVGGTKRICLTWDYWIVYSPEAKMLQSLTLSGLGSKESAWIDKGCWFQWSSRQNHLGMPLRLWHWLSVPGDAEQGGLTLEASLTWVRTVWRSTTVGAAP